MLSPHSRKAAFVVRAGISNSFGAMPRHRGHERLYFRSDGLKNHCLAPNRSSACLMVSTLKGILDFEREMDIWPPTLNVTITMPLAVCAKCYRNNPAL